MPKTNSEAPIPADKRLLITEHNIIDPVRERPKQIAAMKNDSEKNILKTSLPRAPTALRIPISFVF